MNPGSDPLGPASREDRVAAPRAETGAPSMGSAARSGSARASIRDLVRLGVRLGAGYLRHGRGCDAASVVCRWARDAMGRDRGRDLRIPVPGRTLELVGDRSFSEQVLSSPPGPTGYIAGHLKTSAMRFLAPDALTIADGEMWTRLRPFNERVLGAGGPHPFAQAFLERVRGAFARPVSDRDGIRRAMGRAMVGIVLGQNTNGDSDPAEDVRVLFDVVQSPLRRRLLGFLYRRRRERLYGLLRRRWEGSNEGDLTLLALAKRLAPAVDRDALLQQVPHWMFTFTGSGTDLLTRTLTLVACRPGVHRRVHEELAEAGPSSRAETVERLTYLNACLLETGRLFPPVTRTFHRPGAAAGGENKEIVHYFPLLQRDDGLGPTVHDFRPERWLATQPDPAAAASNLFLRGPRACPGMNLILFVCTAAIARLLGEHKITVRSERLSRDPLPVSFPEREARFAVLDAPK